MITDIRFYLPLIIFIIVAPISVATAGTGFNVEDLQDGIIYDNFQPVGLGAYPHLEPVKKSHKKIVKHSEPVYKYNSGAVSGEPI
jgi:hypothetical protein